MDLKGKPLVIVLINDHSNKITPNSKKGVDRNKILKGYIYI